MPPPLAGPHFRPYLVGVRVNRRGFGRGTRPATHVGRRINVPTRPRNSAASGQLEANAKLIRLAVSLIRTAIFSNRSTGECEHSPGMVENSPLASGCGWGMASRTVRTSQYAAVWSISRISATSIRCCELASGERQLVRSDASWLLCRLIRFSAWPRAHAETPRCRRYRG
jgi:hypothetical protein